VNDAANNETVTTLRLHVGGGSRTLGVGTVIHWHMNLDNQIEYVATDAKRETIPHVRMIDRAVAASQDVRACNVSPAMNVTWGTYTSSTGHVDAPGCFRGHDDEHKTSDGRVISQECELCHAFE
jgi:hypothetical protein